MDTQSAKRTISTIIPFYNNENTLSTMLDSILSGTVIPSEILLIDDGSTDYSSEIAKQYEYKYDCIKYLHQEHSGVSSARNLGISSATGYWISFLDADDYIEPSMYEQMLAAITDDTIDGCICGYFTHKEGIITSYTKESALLMSSSEILKDMFTDDNIRGFLFTRLFKTSQIKNYSFDTTISICEDLLLQSQFFSDADRKFVYIPKSFYHYIMNSSSATSTDNMFINGVFKYKPAFERILTNHNKDYVNQNYNAILEYSMYTQLTYYKNGNRSKEILTQIRLLQKELKASPCINKSKRRLAYESAPVLSSHFIL
jgi:glycosyltransferase involved in cell wall biosynthesis